MFEYQVIKAINYELAENRKNDNLVAYLNDKPLLDFVIK